MVEPSAHNRAVLGSNPSWPTTKKVMQKIKKGVIPVAGWGTRFLPATKAVPKELLPIVDKPSIQYIVEEAVASGLEEIILVTRKEKESIQKHFEPHPKLESVLKGKEKLLKAVQEASNLTKISLAYQEEPLGLGHAVLCAKEAVGKEPFIVFLPDDIIDHPIPCARQMIDVYEKYGKPVIALEAVSKERIPLYGVIEPKKVADRVYRILSVVEKPPAERAPSNLTIVGRYILPGRIFKVLEDLPPGNQGEIQLADAVDVLANDDGVYGYEFHGVRHDTGDKLGFLKATVAFAKKHPDLWGPLKSYIQGLVK